MHAKSLMSMYYEGSNKSNKLTRIKQSALIFLDLCRKKICLNCIERTVNWISRENRPKPEKVSVEIQIKKNKTNAEGIAALWMGMECREVDWGTKYRLQYSGGNVYQESMIVYMVLKIDLSWRVLRHACTDRCIHADRHRQTPEQHSQMGAPLGPYQGPTGAYKECCLQVRAKVYILGRSSLGVHSISMDQPLYSDRPEKTG